MSAGEMFFPPEVMISSFFLSVIRRYPSSSDPMSPVCSQPSASMVSAVRSGSL
jgi:hypothetical protein